MKLYELTEQNNKGTQIHLTTVKINKECIPDCKWNWFSMLCLCSKRYSINTPEWTTWIHLSTHFQSMFSPVWLLSNLITQKDWLENTEHQVGGGAVPKQVGPVNQVLSLVRVACDSLRRQLIGTRYQSPQSTKSLNVVISITLNLHLIKYYGRI